MQEQKGLAGVVENIGLNVLIEPGAYLARCIRSELRYFKGWGAKVYLWFKILDGQYKDVELPRIYNVRRIVPLQERPPDFRASSGQDITRDFKRLAGDSGADLDLTQLMDRDFLIDVTTVGEDHSRLELPPGSRYSKVYRIRPKDAVGGR